MIYFSSVCVRCSKLTRPSSGTSESVERRGKLLFCCSRDIFCLAFYAARFIHIRYFFLWLHHCVLLCVLLVFSPFIRVLSTTKKRRILIKTPPPLLQWLFLGFQHSTLRKLKIFFFELLCSSFHHPADTWVSWGNIRFNLMWINWYILWINTSTQWMNDSFASAQVEVVLYFLS